MNAQDNDMKKKDPSGMGKGYFPAPLDKDKTYSVLFIGNSYTFFNDLDVIFASIARSAGYNVNATRITKGGWRLELHANKEDEVGKVVDETLLKNKYDFVIMQEFSTCPAVTPKRFYDGARILTKKIRANGATPFFYETWGRKTGSPTLAKYGLTNETMTWKLAAAYKAIGEELDIGVAYVGLAFYDIYTSEVDITDLYDKDLTHPSYSGSFLAAMTIFAKIFGADTTSIEYNGSLEPKVAEILKRAAKNAVFSTPQIPEQYLTASKGI